MIRFSSFIWSEDHQLNYTFGWVIIESRHQRCAGLEMYELTMIEVSDLEIIPLGTIPGRLRAPYCDFVHCR